MELKDAKIGDIVYLSYNSLYDKDVDYLNRRVGYINNELEDNENPHFGFKNTIPILEDKIKQFNVEKQELILALIEYQRIINIILNRSAGNDYILSIGEHSSLMEVSKEKQQLIEKHTGKTKEKINVKI
jgi:hypothetical protein